MKGKTDICDPGFLLFNCPPSSFLTSLATFTSLLGVPRKTSHSLLRCFLIYVSLARNQLQANIIAYEEFGARGYAFPSQQVLRPASHKQTEKIQTTVPFCFDLKSLLLTSLFSK